MSTENPISLRRNCFAIMIPSGERVALSAGATVWLTQALGGSYTVMTERGYSARIDANDSDALGLTAPQSQNSPGRADGSPGSLRDSVWQELRSCFDPEIPVNIVDLGLIYGCDVQSLESGGHKAVVRFTLTAQGCGMGQFLKQDIERKLEKVPGIEQVDVELVWDPPWNQSMISASAKQQLGIE
ncbi:MAG TPA: putative Fe-S cluster assembly protein SufT [Candidatus Binatia bacterium]|jgi:probable FeS assembly SUF system protein SufT|nr:putative Fe-S cluster assembly protein SufT [Candidatus Binatia bacterium]